MTDTTLIDNIIFNYLDFTNYFTQVTYRSASGKSDSVDFLVMENIFYDKQVQRVYDLKGSERDRYVSQASEMGGKQSTVLFANRGGR